MDMVLQGTLWALLTLWGPAQFEGKLYLTQKACETALRKEQEARACRPLPGANSCISGPNPAMVCMEMPVAPNQVLKR